MSRGVGREKIFLTDNDYSRFIEYVESTIERPCFYVFALCGIKDSPPYMHDGRCLTLEDTVGSFNLIQELKLLAQQKTDLVAFMRTL